MSRKAQITVGINGGGTLWPPIARAPARGEARRRRIPATLKTCLNHQTRTRRLLPRLVREA